MNCLYNLFPKFTYYYFNAADGSLCTKKLNILQWIARKVFGCYQETHLKVIRAKKRELIQTSREHVSKLLADRVIQGFFNKIEACPKSFRIGPSNVLCIPHEDSQGCSLEFEINSPHDLITSITTTTRIHLQRKTASTMILETSQDVFAQGNPALLGTEIYEKGCTSRITQIIQTILGTVLSDTLGCTEIEYHASDDIHEDLNSKRREEMKKLGWRYDREYIWQDGKKTYVYLLQRDRLTDRSSRLPIALNLDSVVRIDPSSPPDLPTLIEDLT